MTDNIRSLRDVAKRKIVQAISEEKIAPGTVITEAQICVDLDLGRTPAREALIELTANRVLEKIPNVGFRVRGIDKKARDDAFVILAELDSLAACLAMRKLSDEDIDRMRELTDLMDVAVKYCNFTDYDALQNEFHGVYVNGCKNQFLIREIKMIKDSVLGYAFYSDDKKMLMEKCASSNKQHREIVRLFAEGEVKELHRYLTEVHWAVRKCEP